MRRQGVMRRQGAMRRQGMCRHNASSGGPGTSPMCRHNASSASARNVLPKLRVPCIYICIYIYIYTCIYIYMFVHIYFYIHMMLRVKFNYRLHMTSYAYMQPRGRFCSSEFQNLSKSGELFWDLQTSSNHEPAHLRRQNCTNEADREIRKTE